MEKLPLSNEQTLHAYTGIETIDSFENIYKRYVGKVYQKCLAMTNDPEMAKDFTQDIFIKVYAKLSTFQNRSTFSTWLYSISHNYCLDYLRSCKRTESLSDTVIREICEPEQTEPLVTPWKALSLFLNNLPEEEVNLLRLKYEQGLSVKFISEQYNLSESSVKMRLKRSRDKLRILCSAAISDTEQQFKKPVYS
ncbi:sigma-70 family RNA polymerase sigma factor [Spirosoma sp. SC4-14]|uniref:RNA polymerase sigma factor n=1 Tax=Spirosoma sp. SC4-14 TaxID=3128900 RepID=UPI0030D55B2B